MVFNIPMIKRINTYYESYANHHPFKNYIMNDINPKQWKRGNDDRQQCTMYGTYKRCGNPYPVPI